MDHVYKDVEVNAKKTALLRIWLQSIQCVKIQFTTSPNMQNVLHACFSMYTKYRDEVPTNLCIFVLYYQTYVVDVQTAHAL